MRQQSGVHHAADLPAKSQKTGVHPLIAIVRILARAAARDWLADPGTRKAADENNPGILRSADEQ
jgi:hypothetical protein